MCIPNTALNNFSKLTETSVQRSPNDGIVNGPLQKGSLTILLSMSIFLAYVQLRSATLEEKVWRESPAPIPPLGVEGDSRVDQTHLFDPPK